MKYAIGFILGCILTACLFIDWRSVDDIGLVALTVEDIKELL